MLRNSKNLFKSMWNENPVRTYTLNESFRSFGSSDREKKDNREEKKPVDIYGQIISEEPKINLNNLDGQIKLVKERMKVLEQHMRNTNLDHEKTALGFLKARKKYAKYQELFKWAITNQDMISELCKKYKVKLVEITSYYRNIPREGVDEIKKFGEANRCVTDIDPFFKLIIDDGGVEEKKDPILLARSPFGNWWYILGAWDKEVEIVDDLIYKIK